MLSFSRTYHISPFSRILPHLSTCRVLCVCATERVLARALCTCVVNNFVIFTISKIIVNVIRRRWVQSCCRVYGYIRKASGGAPGVVHEWEYIYNLGIGCRRQQYRMSNRFGS